MTREELLAITDHEPMALMPDGKIALLIVLPKSDEDNCGFQVTGTGEDIRWHPAACVSHLNCDEGDSRLVVKAGDWMTPAQLAMIQWGKGIWAREALAQAMRR